MYVPECLHMVKISSLTCPVISAVVPKKIKSKHLLVPLWDNQMLFEFKNKSVPQFQRQQIVDPPPSPSPLTAEHTRQLPCRVNLVLTSCQVQSGKFAGSRSTIMFKTVLSNRYFLILRTLNERKLLQNKRQPVTHGIRKKHFLTCPIHSIQRSISMDYWLSMVAFYI